MSNDFLADSGCWTPLSALYHWENQRPEAIWLTQPAEGQVETYTWRRAADEVRRVAAHLSSLGLEPGSRIALLSRNCAQWMLAELAIWMAGHVAVPIYPSLNESTVRYILDHSAAKLLVLGPLDDWDAMRGALTPNLPVLRLRGAPGVPVNHDCWSWTRIVEEVEPLAGHPDRPSESLATLVYTSGTTGAPKGVMLSFRSYAVSSTMLAQIVPIDDRDRLLSYLPLAHVFEGAAVFATALRYGAQVFFNESLKTFSADIQRARPTIFHSVPRLWLKFQLGVLAKLPQANLDALLADPAAAAATRAQLLGGLGLDQVRLAFSGSAPLPHSLIGWFAALGLELLEGLGMSEDFAYSHISRSGRARVGYVGEPLQGVERRIDERGELLIKSPSRMLGYYQAPELSSEVFTADGYFRTGDRAEIDELGRLRLSGRIKELFKTSKGKYVAPAPIESRLLHPMVETVCVAGSGFPQPFALVTLSEAGQKAAQDSAQRAAIGQELCAIKRQINAGLDPHEHLDFMVVVSDQWTVANGFLTPTMKIKRNVVEAHYEPGFKAWSEAGLEVIWAR
ncbi:AMP-binding protein [Nevskia sp.]|uniref:AMP-binding protein n=1 Tax=Nevskia sp. TaxID=1929292 RepID=UPI003F7122DF